MSEPLVLSAEEKRHIRHALGLDNPSSRGCSYRNRFYASEDSPAEKLFSGLCARGAAEKRRSDGPLIRYKITLAGARAALKLGERLDPEDFPEAAQ